jgi:hypothetical protein
VTDETSATAAEATRRRRLRWLTLAEIIGVAALAISGLTLWNSYQARTGTEAERTAARQARSAAAARLLLRGTPQRDGAILTLAPADAGQTVQDQRVAFPAALGIAPVSTVSEPRIEAEWIARALIRARGDGDDSLGDARLPVLLVTSFYAGGTRHQDVAIYDLGYRIEGGGLLGGHRLRLRGLSRIESVAPARAEARLDALWAARRN